GPWGTLQFGRAALEQSLQLARGMTQDADTPRILLLGSSPAVLGLSAEKIAAATKLPTFNLAAPTSVEFFPDYMEMMMPFVRPDDVVVLSDPNWLGRGSKVLS